MRIITISREFGSGGRELGKRMADLLHFDYYDREIIGAVARGRGLNEYYAEHILENHGWQNFPLTFRSSFHTLDPRQREKVEFLLEERRVVEEIAALGKDCVIVGRNADVILRDKNPLRLFVCATESAKLRRCRERAPEDERLSDKGMLRKMREIDKNRAIARGILCGEPWGDRQSYHLIVNTSDWDIRQLAASLAEFALCRFGGEK